MCPRRRGRTRIAHSRERKSPHAADMPVTDIAAISNATTAGDGMVGMAIGTAPRGSGPSKIAAAEAAKPLSSRLTGGTSL